MFHRILNVNHLHMQKEVSICLLFQFPSLSSSPTLLPQVLWDVVPEMEPPLPSFTDLLFFGTRGSAVSTFQSRNSTETMALEFTGEATSIVTVPSQYHPGTITNQLTITYVQALPLPFVCVRVLLPPLHPLVKCWAVSLSLRHVTSHFFPLQCVATDHCWLQWCAGC